MPNGLLVSYLTWKLYYITVRSSSKDFNEKLLISEKNDVFHSSSSRVEKILA